MRVDGNHGPDKGDKNKKDIEGGQKIILETKLERGESKIKDKIKDERKENKKTKLFLLKHEKDGSVGEGDKKIEKSPNGSKEG